MSSPDRSIRAYFEAERAYLRELGAEFGRAHPEIGRLLQNEGSDPSVERLLAGVAFLTGRVRHRLDDDLPELSQGIMQILWPQCVRPIPAMAIQQFRAPARETRPIHIAAGSRLLSIPVQGDPEIQPIRCSFRTVYDVDLPPLQLVEARMREKGDRATLTLRFQLGPGLDLSRGDQLQLGRLRLHLHGDGRVPTELYYYLLHRIRRSAPPLAYASDAGGPTVPLPRPRAVGLGSEEALLPGWGATLESYRLLFEYYALPEKFLFIDLPGLGALRALGAASEFCIDLPFDLPFPRELQVSTNNLRLGCTPIVNLFERSGHPISRLPLRTEYRLLPGGDRNLGAGAEVYTIDSVVGTTQGRGGRREYQPFVRIALQAQRAGVRWYSVRHRSAGDGVETWLTLSPPDNVEDLLKDEVFSASLTCSNGRIASELRAGEINTVEAGAPRGVETENLRAPTAPVAPPLGQGLEWRLAAHLAAPRQTLASREALVRLLTVYNFPAAARHDLGQLHGRRMEAISSVQLRHRDRMVRLSRLPGEASGATGAGPRQLALCRGQELSLSVAFERFGGVGDCYLFGTILDRLLALWVTANSYSRLTLEDTQRKVAPLRWKPRLGHRPLT